MSNPTNAPVPTETLSTVAVDLQDERLIASSGIGGAINTFFRRVRGGELGSLPVIVGLIVIGTVFELLNQSFLTPRNLAALMQYAAPVGVISLGVVLVLLLGEIDLSVGSVAGVSAAITAVTFVNFQWPWYLAVLAAMASGLLIGMLYGFLYNRFGVPSFVITLAGLLAFLGLQLWILGTRGTINLPFESPIVQFAQQTFLPLWLAITVLVVATAAYALSLLLGARRRRAAGLSAISIGDVLLRSGALLVLVGALILYLYSDIGRAGRGVPAVFLFFVALVVVFNLLLTRTKWGRNVFAVGGNVEAARRAGINVRGTYLSVFMLCSLLAATGGVLLASLQAAAGQSSGGGDTNLNAIAAAVIGGTSLFGGRGSAFSALLGILVIWSISNGLDLLNLDSSIRYMITGAVLVIAVIVDSLSRRSRRNAGRG